MKIVSELFVLVIASSARQYGIRCDSLFSWLSDYRNQRGGRRKWLTWPKWSGDFNRLRPVIIWQCSVHERFGLATKLHFCRTDSNSPAIQKRVKSCAIGSTTRPCRNWNSTSPIITGQERPENSIQMKPGCIGLKSVQMEVMAICISASSALCSKTRLKW